MLHIKKTLPSSLSAIALLSLCSLTGCDSLWNGFSVGDPGSCVYTPTLCSSAQFCNKSTGMCEAKTIPPVDSFSYLGIFPNIGRTGGGESVDIRGSGFTPDTVVKIAGQPILQQMTQDDGSTIHGSTPRAPGRCGRVSVEVNRPGFPPVMRPTDFMYKFEPYSAAPVNTTQKILEEVTQIAAADVTGDRAPDLVVATPKTLLWMINQGTGQLVLQQSGFQFSMGIRFATGSFPGTGTSFAPVAFIDRNNNSVMVASPGNNPTMAAAFGKTLRDLAPINLDGKDADELVLLTTEATGGPSLTTLSLVSGGGTNNLNSVSTGTVTMTTMAVLDLNADGLEDVVTGNGINSKLWLGKSDGKAIPALTPATYSPPSPVLTMLAADWDHDGTADLAICGSDGIVTFLKNSGNSQLTPIGSVATGIKSGAGGMIVPPIMQAYDVNCDGLLDLVISPPAAASPMADTTLVVNDGMGRYVVSQTLPSTGGDFAFADFNQDTLPDFAIRQPVIGSAGLSWRLGFIP